MDSALRWMARRPRLMQRCLLVLFVTMLVTAWVSTLPGQTDGSNDEAAAAASYNIDPGTDSSATEPDAVAREDELGKIAEPFIPRWMKGSFLGIALWKYLAAFLFILAGMVARKINDFVFDHRIIPMLKKTPFQFDNLLAEAAYKPLGWLYALAALAAACYLLMIPAYSEMSELVFSGLKVLLAADVVWFLFRVVDVLVHYLERLATRTESKLDDQLIPLVRKSLKVTVGVVCFVWVIQLLGYNVSTLVAGLGIGGLAVALALQDTLANFFGSVFIFIDRPFTVGQRVVVEGHDGVVEQIGFRSTRIRTLAKTLVVIPNKTVAAAAVDNIARMPMRRVVQTVGLTYESSAEDMQKAVDAINEIIHTHEKIDQEFTVAQFSEFGESSLNIEIIYFTKTVDYNEYLGIKQEVNLAMMRAVESLGLSIAFPTRTLYLEGDIARALAKMPEQT